MRICRVVGLAWREMRGVLTETDEAMLRLRELTEERE
jgi:hypothetical protein